MLGGFRVAVALILLLPVPSAFAERGAIDPGKYILYTGGCISCHTSAFGPDLAGGVPIETHSACCIRQTSLLRLKPVSEAGQ